MKLNDNELSWQNVYYDVHDFGIGQNPKVILTHIPTGLQVECDFERSLVYNRKIAFGMMCEKINNLNENKND